MPDYTVTPANVLASIYAQRFVPNVLSQISVLATSARQNINVAGTTITAGQTVYQDPTTMAFFPADANGASSLYKVIGIAEHGAALGQPLSIVIEDPQFTPGCTLAIGDLVIASDTPGGITEAANKASGWFVTDMGVAFSTTQMKLKLNRSDVARA